MDKGNDDNRFSGFEVPEQNWFKMPNTWTDVTHDIKSLAELKCVEYVLRHTWGYSEYGTAKRISNDEFMYGRRRRDGSRMDRGTGLTKRSVIDGLRNAVTHGYLLEDRDDTDKGRAQKFYRLRLKHLHQGVKNLHSRSEESSHRSEKDTQDRNLTVNGFNPTTSPICQLPDIPQPTEQVELVAGDILRQFGDEHSNRFYHLVARKVPASIIYESLSEIRSDGAREPAKAFTFRMNKYALERSK